MIVQEVIELFRKDLADQYESGELEQIIFLCFEEIKKYSKIDLVIRKDEIITEAEQSSFEKIFSALKSGMPVQYALMNAWFYGMKLFVNENVLIPRQETEELVDWIIRESENIQSITLKILDICTGSGCIAIALKKKLPDAEVTAIDLSVEALKIAEKNAEALQTKINFIQSDILQPDSDELKQLNSFDIMVSNPPYVLESEKQQMLKRTLDFEPRLALFVNDNDPLIFYKRIAELAIKHLKENGKLFFEINEQKGDAVVDLLKSSGFKDVQLRKDLNGKNRMVSAKK
jgi:release factor glutamine methyltransferase